MKIYLQLLIIISVFLIILWFQNQDDKKHEKIRNGYYDTYKFPVLMSSIIALLLNISTNKKSKESDIFMSPIPNENILDRNVCSNKYRLLDVDTGRFE